MQVTVGVAYMGPREQVAIKKIRLPELRVEGSEAAKCEARA